MTDLLLGWLTHLGNFSYLIVFVLVFAESGLLLLLPGETVLLLAGVLASRHILLLAPLIVVGCTAAALGDTSGYFLGRGPARRRFHATGRFFVLRAEKTDRVVQLLNRHGAWAIVVSRFVGLLRVATPFVCGLTDIPPERFFPVSLPTCLVWGTSIATLGYLGGNAWQKVHHWIGRGSLALGVVILIGVLVWDWRRRNTRAP
jgi:membrane protein DedA with SNARE-associated domain